MSTVPQKLLDSLTDVRGFNRDEFVRVHEERLPVTSIRINTEKTSEESFKKISGFNLSGKVPWAESGFYLENRPSFTFDPLFHAGCYYVQEPSSMFLEIALKQLTDLSQPLKVLDLCAAPGGKSTHIQSLISEKSILVSNEVIKARSNILVDNIIKWGARNVVVTNNDPAAFQRIPGFFDVIVVDAPCSGSGLFRKDEGAVDEWSINNVQLCSQRQQRILADVLPALKENGLLIYSTCSYSKEEDEDISNWLVNEFEMENMKLNVPAEWNIIESEPLYGYRFFPDKVSGEGFFMSCFRKTTNVNEGRWKQSKVEKVPASEIALIKAWLKDPEAELLKENDLYFSVTPFLAENYSLLRYFLNIQYRGTGVGEIMKNKLVPDHSFALSLIISEQVPVNEVDYNEAILYLQRKDLSLKPANTGWQLISYQNHNIGWINALPNRINNYYPKELRILKDSLITAQEK